MSRHRANPRPAEDDRSLSFDVKVWKISIYDGKKGKSYAVRWTVAGASHRDTFRTRALAESFRSKLISYQREGVAFDIETGLPQPMLRHQKSRSWYDHICRYIDARWHKVAPKSRKSIADTLATVTASLVRDGKEAPDSAEIRELVYGWVCVKPRRAEGPPPVHLQPALRYLERNTIDMSLFEDRSRGPEVTRKALDAIAIRLDGQPAAPNTISRKRAVVYNVIQFGVEDGVISLNPIDYVTWRTPKQNRAIDKRTVPSLQRGQDLLDAVGQQGEMGRRLKAFFASQFYAALRPAEALRLGKGMLTSLPPQGWGEMQIGRSLPRSGTAWSNTGRSREERSLKHRAEGDFRTPPVHPELVKIFIWHIDTFGTGPNGELFIGPRGGLPDESTYLRIWQAARVAVLTPEEQAMGLVKRPYDNRHFAISFWLWAGVSVTQVAAWAGNSPAVIWEVYAKIINGLDAEARRMVDDATVRALIRHQTPFPNADQQ